MSENILKRIWRFHAKETNKWDWIVPIGFQIFELGFIAVFIWFFSYDGFLRESRLEPGYWNKYLFYVLVILILIIIMTRFFSRLQRVMLFPLLWVFFLIYELYAGNRFSDSLINSMMKVTYSLAGYTIGSLLILIFCGNNVPARTEKIRLWMVTGFISFIFGIFAMFFFAFLAFLLPIPIFKLPYYTGDLLDKFLPERFVLFFGVLLWGLVFGLIGALIGKIMEKSQAGSSILAAALSFIFIGLGQIYNRQFKKALMLWLISFLATSIVNFLSILFYPSEVYLLGYPAWLIIWLYSIYDAYTYQKRKGP